MFARTALALTALLTTLVPTSPVASYSLPTQLASLEASVALANPGSYPTTLLALSEAETQPANAVERCTASLPEGRSRWAGRTSDDEWIPGLYPAVEDYEGMLALTFDDGPHRSRTPIALDELAKHGLPATFFLTGNSVRASTYDLVQRMVDEGHELANHGWRHDTNMARLEGTPAEQIAYVTAEFELTQIRVDLALLAESAEDFEAMDDEVFGHLHRFHHDREEQLARMPRIRARHRALLDRHGYLEGDHPYTMRYVRPPGGNPYVGGRWTVEERELFATAINRMGLIMVMWNSGSGDSNTKLSKHEREDPERVAATARDAAAKGGIYIAHDRIEPKALHAMIRAAVASPVDIVDLDTLREAKLRALGAC